MLGRLPRALSSLRCNFNRAQQFRAIPSAIRFFSGQNKSAQGSTARPVGVPTPATFETENPQQELKNVVDLEEADLPPIVEAPDSVRDAKAHPVIPEFLPLRDMFYADRSLDFFLNPEHRRSIATAYDLWQQGKFERALTELENADDRDPAVILAVSHIFKHLGRMTEAKQVLLHFIDTVQDDSVAQAYCWTALRELGHEPDAASADQVLGVVFEKGGFLGTDIFAMYRDRRSYSFINGGRDSFVADYIAQYPDYATGEEARANREKDLKRYGSPIEHGPIGAPVNYTKATDDFVNARRQVAQNAQIAKIDDREVPIRLTFLTPAGKRVLEGDLATLKTAKGALNPVVRVVSTIAHCMKAVRLLKVGDDRILRVPPVAPNVVMSMYQIQQSGFDRNAPPAKPLELPAFVKLQMEARAFLASKQRAEKQPFRSPF